MKNIPSFLYVIILEAEQEEHTAKVQVGFQRLKVQLDTISEFVSTFEHSENVLTSDIIQQYHTLLYCCSVLKIQFKTPSMERNLKNTNKIYFPKSQSGRLIKSGN